MYMPTGAELYDILFSEYFTYLYVELSPKLCILVSLCTAKKHKYILLTVE